MSASGDADMKGGHAPAVKAGGMRITQHKPAKPEEEQQDMTEEEKAEYGEQPEPDTHKQSVVIAGVVTKGDQDFPPAAVKVYHDKPLPTHQKTHSQPKHNINQPR